MAKRIVVKVPASSNITSLSNADVEQLVAQLAGPHKGARNTADIDQVVLQSGDGDVRTENGPWIAWTRNC